MDRDCTPDWTCDTCGFTLYVPVLASRLKVTRLGLYDDARFPGRCLLAYNRHEEHLEALEADQLTAFWSDAAVAGAALKAVTSAARVNYAVLGNAQPHMHAHLIPRKPEQELLPTRPPWNDPRDLAPVDPDLFRLLRTDLANLLN